MKRLGIPVLVAVGCVVGLAGLAASPVAAQQAAPPEWQSLDLPGLTALALKMAGLATVDSHPQITAEMEPGLKQLGAHVASRYAAAAAQGPVDPADWLDLAVALGPYLPAAQKTAMANTFKNVLVPSVEAVKQMDAVKAVRAIRAVERLGDVGYAAALECAWIEGSDQFKSLSPLYLAHLSWLTNTAGAKGDAAQNRLADLITTTLTDSPEKMSAATPRDWQVLAEGLAARLTESQKDDWANRIQDAFKGRPITPAEAAAVQGAVKSLVGTASEETRALDLAGLMALTLKTAAMAAVDSDPRIDWSVEPKIKELAAYVGHLYAAAAAQGPVNPADWLDLAVVLGPYVPSPHKTAMARAFKDVLVPSVEAVKQMDAVKAVRSIRAVERLGDIGYAAALECAWIEGSDQFKSLSPLGLAHLSWLTNTAGAKGAAAQKRLVDQIGGTVMASPDAVRAGSLTDWRIIVDGLAKGLTSDTRAAWATKLRGAFVDDGATLGAMGMGDLERLTWTLGALKDGQARDVPAKWVDSTAAWQSLKLADLTALARMLSAGGTASAGARARMVDHVMRARAPQLATCALPEIRAWGDLADALGLSTESRLAWADVVRSTYGKDSQQLDNLMIGDLETLCGFLNRMRDPKGPLLAAKYAIDVDAARSWESVDDLKRLLRLLPRTGERAKVIHQPMVEQLTTRVLGDQAKTVMVGLGSWRELIDALKGSLTPESRKVWAKAISDAFAPSPEAAMSLQIWDFKNLLGCLGPLDQPSASALALARLSDRSRRATMSLDDSSELVQWALQGDAKAVSPIMDSLDTSWQSDDAVKPAGAWQVLQMWECLSGAGKMDKAKEWAMRFYSSRVGTEAARQSVDPYTVLIISELLWRSGLTDKRENYPAYGAALAILVRKGADIKGADFECKLYARALGGPETRQILFDDLVDSQGSPRLAAARILAWAYRERGELQQWRDKVEEKIGASQGDAKALWLVVKGFTEPLLQEPPNPWRRGFWLKSALAAAATDPCRLIVLREMTDSFRETNQAEMAADFLESVKGQFGVDAAYALADLQAQVRREVADRKAEEARVRAAQDLARKQLRLKDSQARLTQAQAAGNAGDATRLLKVTQDLAKEIAP